jgi:hypothetical protein
MKKSRDPKHRLHSALEQCVSNIVRTLLGLKKSRDPKHRLHSALEQYVSNIVRTLPGLQKPRDPKHRPSVRCSGPCLANRFGNIRIFGDQFQS